MLIRSDKEAEGSAAGVALPKGFAPRIRSMERGIIRSLRIEFIYGPLIPRQLATITDKEKGKTRT